MSIPLIFKSPARSAGILPSTETSNEKALLLISEAVPSDFLKV